MIKKIGYACINTALKPKSFKECRLNSIYKYGIDYLREKILNNIILTKDILEWNVENDIYMYRVTSSLFPLVNHPDIQKDFRWRWQEDEKILSHMEEIKQIVRKNNIRLSMHPDQFTVLNSLNEKVVKNSIDYLQYHYEVLKHLGGSDIIIHTGGVYGDKEASKERFIKNFSLLDEKIQQMIRLENDDVSYTVEEVLFINEKTGIPVVLDVHHHRCNNEGELTKDHITRICDTWKTTGMIPKMHISSGSTRIDDKHHHDYIAPSDFIDLMEMVKDKEIDLMVEAKKKEQAVLKIKDNL